MQFLIHFDAFTELPTAPPRAVSPRLISWRWIIVSIFAHVLMLLLLLQFTNLPNVQEKQDIQLRPVITAQLLMPKLITKAAPETVPKKVSPKVKPKSITAKPEPSKPVPAPETLPTVESPPALPQSQPPSAPKPTASEQSIALPQQAFSFTQATPDILSPSHSRLLSATTNRQEVQAFFNSYNSDEAQIDAQQESDNFATAQISPELFAGVPELSPAEQDAKVIYEAKIDVDCSSDVNKLLATISAFTLHAVVCQSNANIDTFIQQRLTGKDSQERLQGLKPIQQRKQSN